MTLNNHKYSFACYSNAFLDRAQTLIKRFDETEDVSSLLYAALELRYGIESRLYEYIDAACRTLKVASEKKKEYAATRLLKILKEMIPDAEEPVTLVISEMGTQGGIGLRYTPVTLRLAKMHGQLGEMLHISFFRKNPHWYDKISLTEVGYRSLVDFRQFLGEVAKELKEASSGHLLSSPQFTSTVERILSDEEVKS